MRGALWFFVVLLLGIALAMSSRDRIGGGGAPSQPAAESPRNDDLGAPRSMAAIGDSITQAANVGFGSGDWALEHSWATGRSADDPVVSHLERLRAGRSSNATVAHNVSFSGARMRDAVGQARVAVSRGADYVTFLMGANDACTSSLSSMTPVQSFRHDFDRALAALTTGLPDAIVYVVSIPDVYRLWDVMIDNAQARESWSAFGTCGALLDARNSERDRLRVRQRIEQFNEILEEGCRRYERCHYDGGAVFRYPFTAEDVSPLDFFHPSITGQSHLAEVTWRHGPFTGSDGVARR